MNILKSLLYRLPRRRKLSPGMAEGLAESQRLAYACAKAVASELREGWTEVQAARLMLAWLGDHGVSDYFHKPFAWFGERARFDGMAGFRDTLPSGRALAAGESYILDVAPVYRGYPADIGYSSSLGPSSDLRRGRELLIELRSQIQGLFNHASSGSGISGGDISAAVTRRIEKAGYEARHHWYPFAVLGHRLHPMAEGWRPPTWTPFGFAAVTHLLWEGIYPDLLNEEHRGELNGAWAIEPHLGGKNFGCKFEEILIVEGGGARWLSEQAPWL